MEPPAEAWPASHARKKSCSEPRSHDSSSVRARCIIFSMAVCRTDNSASFTSTASAAAHAAPVQYSSGTCLFRAPASAASGSAASRSRKPGRSSSSPRSPYSAARRYSFLARARICVARSRSCASTKSASCCTKAYPYCVNPLAAAVSRPRCRGDSSSSDSIVLSAKGTASRMRSGSLSLANVDELPDERAFPIELMAIILMEQPVRGSASAPKTAVRSRERHVAVMGLQGRRENSITACKYALGPRPARLGGE